VWRSHAELKVTLSVIGQEVPCQDRPAIFNPAAVSSLPNVFGVFSLSDMFKVSQHIRLYIVLIHRVRNVLLRIEWRDS